MNLKNKLCQEQNRLLDKIKVRQTKLKSLLRWVDKWDKQLRLKNVNLSWNMVIKLRNRNQFEMS
jgi:hypothetical protein